MTESLGPTALGPLELRNPLVRAGCYEGLTRDGRVTERLIDHHRDLAAGGIGMTTLSYCAVAAGGRGFADQLWMRPEIGHGLRELCDAVHAEGAAVSAQLVHCGFFADPAVTVARIRAQFDIPRPLIKRWGEGERELKG